MDTILPKGFVFDSSKVLTPNRMDTNAENIFIRQIKTNLSNFGFMNILITICILVIALLAIWCIIDLHFIPNIIKSLLIFTRWIIVGIFIVGGVLLLYKPRDAFDENCEFRLQPNSNLIVKQYTKTENTIKGEKSYLDLGDYPKNDHEKKAYPYKVYVKDKIGNKLVYLGKATNNRVSLDYQSDISKTFVSYCNYINIHHLNDKFTKTLKFERDPYLLDTDGLPQYVLKGDGITLKAKPLQAHKYKIYVDKD